LNVDKEVAPFFAAYRETLPPDRRSLFDHFKFVDVAFKVVGVGSVGTRCYVALMMADRDDPLFLQIKEARASVFEGLAGPSPYTSNSERVVTGQRLMQSASDIFLGWSKGPGGNDFYVRQLRDQKAAADLATIPLRLFFGYARLCGR